MADTPNSNDILRDVLQNPDALDRIAVSKERGNQLTEQDGVAKDLTELSYGELLFKYGPEVANNRFRIQDSYSDIGRIRRAEREGGDVLDDTALSIAGGFTNLAGNTVGVAAGYGLGELFLDDGRLGAVATTRFTGDVVEDIKSGQTTQLKERQRLQAIEGELDAADSEQQFKDEIEAGRDPFAAALSRVGRDALNTAGRITNDAAVTGDLVAESFGSLGPSSALAGIGGKVLAGTVSRVTANQTAARVAQYTGTTVAIGASEASGAYTDAVDRVMQLNIEQLNNSALFRHMVSEGMSPAEAQIQLAGLTGETAFTNQLPASMALGMLTSRFEAAPIGSFRGAGMMNALKQVSLQGVEEAGQGATATISTNAALNEVADQDIALSEGVGESAASGFIGGIGQAGASGGVAAAQTIADVTSAVAPVAAEAAVDGAKATTQAVKDRATNTDRQSINRLKQLSEGSIASAVQEEVEADDISDGLLAIQEIANESGDPVVQAGQIQVLSQKFDELPPRTKEFVRRMLDTKEVQDVLEKAANTDQNQQEAPAEITQDTVKTTVGIAKTNPANVNPEVVNKILEQDTTPVSESDLPILRGAARIAKAVNDRTSKQVEITRDNNIGLKKQGRPEKPANSTRTASRSIRVQGYTDSNGNDLRSINDFGSDIMQAAQGGVDPKTGRKQDPAALMAQFGLLVEHLNNKVSALNQSFDSNNDKGNGKSIPFRSIYQGVTMKNPGEQGSARPVAYHRSNPNSAAFAREVAADRDAAIETYNALKEMFPDQLGEVQDFVVEPLREDKGGYIDVESLRAEIAAQEAAELASVEAQQGERRLRKDAVLKASESLIDDESEAPGQADAVVEAQAETTEEATSEVTEDTQDDTNDTGTVEADEVNVDADPNDFDPFSEDEIKKIEEKENQESQERAEKTGSAVWHGVSVYKDFYGLNAGDRPNISRQIDPNHFFFSYITTTGLEVAGHFTWKNNVITDLAIASEEGPLNDFKGVRETFGKILSEFPKTNFLHAYRVSGARSEAQNIYFKLLNQKRLKNISKELFIEQTGVDPSVVEPDAVINDETDGVNVEADIQIDQGSDKVSDERSDADVSIDQGSDTIVDSSGKPIDFFHGTNAVFSEFNDKPVFLTTRKGLAREHARRGEAGSPRLIRTNVSMSNPLTQQIPDDQDPDIYWLHNAAQLEQLQADNNHDGIYIFNDKEGMIITGRDNVTQLDKDFDNSLPESERANLESNDSGAILELDTPQELNVHESFNEAYVAEPKDVTNLETFMNKHGKRMNPAYSNLVEQFIPFVKEKMNARIQAKKVSGKPLVSLLAEGAVQSYRNLRNTAIVDPNTGEYNSGLVDLAGLAFTDWMLHATGTHPNRVGDRLKDLGVSELDLTDEQFDNLSYGVPIKQAVESIAQRTLDLWGVKANDDASLAATRGIVEGVINEMLTVTTEADDNGDSLLKIGEIPSVVNGETVTAYVLRVDGEALKSQQASLKENREEGLYETAREAETGEKERTYSFGTPITTIANNQTRSKIKTSKLEKAALAKMQSTPYYLDRGRLALMDALGDDVLRVILGYNESVDDIKNTALKKSVEGSNRSIERNISDAREIADQMQDDENDTPVFFSVGITKVGRHQYQGINPQTNKVLRELTPTTWGTYDFKNTQHMNAFWLAIAQQADLAKIEKEPHVEILKTIGDKFQAEFGTATDMVLALLKGEEFNAQEFATAVGQVEMHQLAAIHAVAEMRLAEEQGHQSFRSSIGMELDGLTNGAANMMVNFGQGEFDQQQFNNLQRIGFFIGKTSASINDFFKPLPDGSKRRDLYETTAAQSMYNMTINLNKMKPEQRALMQAAGRFAAKFGDFKLENEDDLESWTMTRNTAKNPMTKVNYGSGVNGVGYGIADDMLVELYRKMQSVPSGKTLEEFFGYPGMQADMELLLGRPLKGLTAETVFFGNDLNIFRKSITQTIGQVLTDSTKQVIGDEITRTNDLLVFATNIQTEFLKLKFDRMLKERAEQLAQEGKIGRNKKGDPILSEITNRDYKAIVNEMQRLAPIMASDEQTLAVSGFDNQRSDMQLSANMDDKLRMNSNLPGPGSAGVKVIPFGVIGTGDAMMMNFVYGNDTVGMANDTLPIFDGINIPPIKLAEYSQHVNEQVLKTWDRDVMSMAITNFDGFLAQTTQDQDLLNEAFATAKELSKKARITFDTTEQLSKDLNKRLEANRARKRVLKRIATTVDQMGGSGRGYTRGDQELSMNEINVLIDKEMRGVPAEKEPAMNTIKVTNAANLVDNMKMGPVSKKVWSVIKPMLPADIQIVIGDIDALNQYRSENYATNGEVLKGNGNFDFANNVLFVVNPKIETVLHELVHAATYSEVLAHYNGDQRPAVARLEELMNEFMGLDVINEGQRLAQAAILQQQAQNTPEAQAAAVNEFMAWSLTNREIAKQLKGIKGTLTRLATVVRSIMRKMLGGVPENMFDEVVFATQILNEKEIDDGNHSNDNNGNGRGNGNDSDGSDPEAFSNFWINLVKDHIQKNRDNRTELSRVSDLGQSANEVVRNLRQSNLLRDPESRKTFRAIYTVMGAEFKLRPQGLIALNKLFNHIEENLAPDMFDDPQDYSDIISAISGSRRETGDAAAVLLALSQTSRKFREILGDLPNPEGEFDADNGLALFMAQVTNGLFTRFTGDLDITDRNVKRVLDDLANGLVDQDLADEYRLMQKATRSFDTADKWTSRKFRQIADWNQTRNEQVQAGTRADWVKIVSGISQALTDQLDGDKAADAGLAIKSLINSNKMDKLIPVREIIQEVISTDDLNRTLIGMYDTVSHSIAQARQAFREDLPGILERTFENGVTPTQMTSMMNVIAKTDAATLTDSVEMLKNDTARAAQISELEKDIRAAYLPYVAQDVLDKALQLAQYINGQPAGRMLLRNAYAIVELADEHKPHMEEVIDRLITLYAIDGMPIEDREDVANLHNNDPEAVEGLIAYIKFLNDEEEGKAAGTQAKLNALKGYIPNHGAENRRIVVADTRESGYWESRGYQRLGDFEGDTDSAFEKSYYVSTVRESGNYSQGIMQNVQKTFKGVDVRSGLSVTGDLTGYVNDPSTVERITQNLIDDKFKTNDAQTLVPVFDADKAIVGYQYTIDPQYILELRREENLAIMLGAWHGRQLEEERAAQFNYALVDELKALWDNRDKGTDNEFINVAETDDPVLKEAWKLVPKEIKDYIETTYGEDGFMIRKTETNVAVGYREATVTDMWSGKSRLPKGFQQAFTRTAHMFLGSKAMKYLTIAEQTLEGSVSSAKDIIVIRSLVVPAANFRSNLIQLAGRGVPLKTMVKGFRDKLSEVEQMNENVTKMIELEAKLLLAGNDTNKRKIIETQIENIKKLNSRMSIAPMVEAGQYKNLSEGLTDIDREISKGKLGDLADNLVAKLPAGVRTVGEYGLVSKSTKLYQLANRATQYGDFLAKSIYYDHLIKQGLSNDEAVSVINQEYVNFSFMAGRTRSALERYGFLWFPAFKLRSAKIAMNQIRENPVRTLAMNAALPDVGTPVQDNIFTITGEGRLGYAVGWEMMFDAPQLNPWYNLING